MISFACPCGKPFRFSLKFRGRPFRCNACGRPLVVPEESQTTGVDDVTSAGSDEIITPVKPVMQIDPGSLPASLNGETIDEYAEDEIIISGRSPKIKEEEHVFHVDLNIDESNESDSISTVLSKAAIAQQIKVEQEQIEATQAEKAASEQKPPKKAGGILSGIFKKKPKAIDASNKPAPAPKTKEKALKKQPEAQPVADSKPEKLKKAGFLSNLFKKKPKVAKATDAADGETAKPVPAKNEPKTLDPKKEKVKKAGFFSGLFRKKPKTPLVTHDY